MGSEATKSLTAFSLSLSLFLLLHFVFAWRKAPLGRRQGSTCYTFGQNGGENHDTVFQRQQSIRGPTARLVATPPSLEHRSRRNLRVRQKGSLTAKPCMRASAALTHRKGGERKEEKTARRSKKGLPIFFSISGLSDNDSAPASEAP